MTFKEKDFVEIEFTGKIKNGEIFDSNIKEDLAKMNTKGSPKPFIFCIGEGMFVKGVDKFLIGKDTGEYDIPLKPEEAFGSRNPKLIQMIPMKVFIQHQINPIPGITFNFDGKLAKVLTVSGGRVMVDFNNPISGKETEYHVKVLRKVEDLNERIEALNEFFFRQSLKFEVKDTQKGTSKKLILEMPQGASQFALMFKDKYKEIFDLDLEAKEVKIKKSKAEGKEVASNQVGLKEGVPSNIEADQIGLKEGNEVQKEMPTSESLKEKISEKVEEAKEKISQQ